MILRKIKPNDNKALATMIRNVFEEFGAPKEGTVYSDPTTDNLYELFSKNKKNILWVAEIDNNPVGCCGIFATKGLSAECTELVKFYISSNARGKGIGKALLEKSVQSAKDNGFSELYLESIPAFSKAVNIYKKQGFISLDKPLGNTGHSGCDIWMLKKI